MNLDELIGRERIRDCLARYCRAVDRQDFALLRSCYWDDAVDDHAIFVGTVDEFVEYALASLATMVHTRHTIGQSLISITGNMAAVETHLTAYHRVHAEGGIRDFTLGGRFVDRFEKRDDDWRLIHRVLVADWISPLSVSEDISQGLLGAPFVSEHAIGSARDDFSEKLFPRWSE